MAYTFGFPLTDRFAELRREMDQLFEEFGGGFLPTAFRRTGVYPAVNIWDEGNNVMIEAEIPGVRKEDIEVFAAGNELTIRGRRQPLEGEKSTLHRQERGTGEFSRVVTLPVDVEPDRIEATLRNGILTLTLPKAETAKPKQITVKTQ